jgi:glucokinase
LSHVALGIDLGGTQVKLAWFPSDQDALAGRQTFPTRDGEGSPSHPAWAVGIRHWIQDQEARGLHFASIGLAAPGLARADGRAIAHMPGRLAGLENLDWTDFLQRPVPVLNDAQAALLGEAWQGAARGCADALLITLGTGVGGAILSGGRLLHGTIGRAGHVGHLSLNPEGSLDIVRTPGSLEDAIGDCTLPARSRNRFHTTRDLIAAVHQGDPDAQAVWDPSVRALAAAIASLINLLDPRRIVLGGGIAEAGDTLLLPLRARLDAIEWRPAGHHVELVRAQLGEWAGAWGAARHGQLSQP